MHLRIRRFTSLPWCLLVAAGCSSAAERHAEASEAGRDYRDPVVLFVSPDSAALARMRRSMGDDAFYTVADDAMWYQAQATERLDSLRVPYRVVQSGAMTFRVNGRQAAFTPDSDRWMVLVYDGRNPPQRTTATEIAAHPPAFPR